MGDDPYWRFPAVFVLSCDITRGGGNATARRLLRKAETQLGQWEHTAARISPRVIGPRPRKLTVAVTAHCNLRCVGCQYGRDFIPGHQLSYPVVYRLLTDAKEAG